MGKRKPFDLREQLRHARGIGEALRTPQTERLAEYFRQQADPLWNSPPASETSSPEPTFGNFAATEAADSTAVDGSVASAGNFAATEAADSAAVDGSVASVGNLVASEERADTAVVDVTRGRRAGGGRRRFFTDEECERLQAMYQQILKEDPSVEDEIAVTTLRSLVSAEKRGAEHLRTYQRYVFEPIRRKVDDKK